MFWKTPNREKGPARAYHEAPQANGKKPHPLETRLHQYCCSPFTECQARKTLSTAQVIPLTPTNTFNKLIPVLQKPVERNWAMAIFMFSLISFLLRPEWVTKRLRVNPTSFQEFILFPLIFSPNLD